ncbi:CAP domain-containing protein [Nostoc sp. TCL26-01]|uniref:CAP domain-containing protein n=1 Tax=Nostoc sp. TCL26-01 TaxID=2576904 RepID=UPI00277B50E8|nr:CAP domain-containing protein [Nostoc sp. TCL26-01]
MIRSKINNFVLGALVVLGGVIAISEPAHTYIPKSLHRSVSSRHLLAQSTIDIANVEASVFQQINQFRTSQGLPALTRNASIDNQARIHSQNMANGTVPFGHYNFAQRVQAIAIPYQAAAENVATNRGYSDPATQAVQGWLRSSGHLNNIRGNYNLTGVGVAVNSKGEVYLTQIFIRTSSQTSTPTNPQSTINIANVEASVFQQINQFRTSQGLPALTRNASIDNQARIHSQNMASGTVPFGHYNFAQRVQAIAIPYQAAAENVATNRGYSDPATQAVQGWLRSSGHLNNIKGNYNLTGIGVAVNSKGEVYLTQIFIRKP